MSVIGFDIGNENCVVAVVKQRGIDVLLNDESKRETPAVVSFGEKQRFLGSAGVASATMNPKSTISQVKRLIGLNFSQPDVQEEFQRFPFAASEAPDGGILIHLQYLGEIQMFTPVQILAMLLSHLKEITEKNLEMPVSDCVIGIPAYFTDLQRRAYLNAAAIAGLKPLRLVHDTTATALGYGIYKTDFVNAGPTNVVFVDIGHCDTQVSIVSFEVGHMRVVSHAFDRCLGGRDFDEVLFGHFAAQFKEQYKIDVYSNIRACVRLRAACEKLKKVLSANAEAPINIECLMDEKDVKGYIKREEFEKLSSGLLERISVPCYKAMADAGLSLEKIHSVELVGSGSRIPAVTRMLAALFRREPSRTLNASECVARGCALQCAMLSPIFRVRDYEIGPFQVSHNEKPKVKVRVRLNLHGIVTVESASLVDDEIVDPVPRGAATHSNLEKVELELASDVSSPMVANGTENGTFSQSESLFTPEVQSTSVDGMSKGRSSRRLEIPITETIYGGMSKSELSKAQEKEFQLAQQDRVMEQTKDRRNALEAYVYEMRNKLFDTYRSFATDLEREEISRRLQQTEEWLYEDGDNESEKVYTSKLGELKKLVDPIENRLKDAEARPQATRDLLKHIVDYRMAVGSLATSEKDAVINECNKAEQWLREKSQQQDSLPKNTDPILWSSEIRKRAEALDMTCRHIMRPKPPHPRQGDSKSHSRANSVDGTRTE
ncbi:heat shock 70 kDa protein 16-like isoform X4 [Tasmannia lanceolata]|uniref:heat shock 70 kDa protein 16-like isoform X4 n=1 Tax=Tasmannia lanceolata TaxID=3420 RepID=UPI00406322B0